jgi:hypothetical protein
MKLVSDLTKYTVLAARSAEMIVAAESSMQSQLGAIFYTRDKSPYFGKPSSVESSLCVQTSQEKLLVCALLTGRELCQLVLNIRMLACATHFKNSYLHPTKYAFNQWKFQTRKRGYKSAGALVQFLTKGEIKLRFFATWQRERALSVNFTNIAIAFYVRRQTRKVIYALKWRARQQSRRRLVLDGSSLRRAQRAIKLTWHHWSQRARKSTRRAHALSRASLARDARIAERALLAWSLRRLRARRASLATSTLHRSTLSHSFALWAQYLFIAQRKCRAARVIAAVTGRRARRAAAYRLAEWRAAAGSATAASRLVSRAANRRAERAAAASLAVWRLALRLASRRARSRLAAERYRRRLLLSGPWAALAARARHRAARRREAGAAVGRVRVGAAVRALGRLRPADADECAVFAAVYAGLRLHVPGPISGPTLPAGAGAGFGSDILEEGRASGGDQGRMSCLDQASARCGSLSISPTPPPPPLPTCLSLTFSSPAPFPFLSCPVLPSSPAPPLFSLACTHANMMDMIISNMIVC